MYALQYEDVERAGVILDRAVCGQRLSCKGDIACTSATGIRQCADKGFVVAEKWRAYVIIFIFMIEVTQWRDGMVKFYCDERFGGWEGCVPRVVVDACAEESVRGKRDL